MKFANMGQPNRLWTISTVNGQVENLVALHRAIFDKFQPGDRLVYTGNYLCGTTRPQETLDEILYFRRTLLACPGMMPDDFIYLRGVQETLWSKILQLPFAPDPVEVVTWITHHHPEMNDMFNLYGSSLRDALRMAREGVMSLTRWTAFLKAQMRQMPGHNAFFTAQRRAAFTEDAGNDNHAAGNGGILFVHAGINAKRPLHAQGESLWWPGTIDFNGLEKPYRPFRTVVRGFDPARKGVHIGPVTISLDNTEDTGNNRVLCAQISGNGHVLELLAA
ncbi:MAG: hypothetical protein OXT65_00945 [Alphaproteobacteria bacterium]|nr:hypothetical protein [Alphaproteobacteria bacterium]